MPFAIGQPDLARSPHTGMVRRHWLEAIGFLLEGVVRHTARPAEPIILPGPQARSAGPAGAKPEDRPAPIDLETLARPSWWTSAPWPVN